MEMKVFLCNVLIDNSDSVYFYALNTKNLKKDLERDVIKKNTVKYIFFGLWYGHEKSNNCKNNAGD